MGLSRSKCSLSSRPWEILHRSLDSRKEIDGTSGIYSLTYHPCLGKLVCMPENPRRKQQHLREAELLHAHPERVQDSLFEQFPDFFDAHDQLQVRYEMLRSHRVDDQKVTAICQRYGVSRQTFYNLQERFLSEGTAGLLSSKPGPKGPSKLTRELLQFVERRFQQEPHLGGSSLVSQLEERFGVSFHKRTLEKLLKELRSKKNR